MLPVFVLDHYEGLEAGCLQDMPWESATRYVEANAARDPRARAGRPRLREPHPARRPGRRRGRPAVPRQGARLGARVLDAREARADRLGARVARGGRGGLRRLGAHPRRGRGRGRPRRARRRGPAGRGRRRVPAARREPRRSPRLLDEARRDPPNPGNRQERLPDEGNAERLEAFLAGDRPTVVFVGKLIENKGVHVLLEALRGLDARALIVGFGDYREELEALAPPDTLFTGALEHRHLAHLLPLADVSVVPSIFPEAFGMVAAEAAAAGVPPLVARHSGLAEVAAGLEHEYPPEHRDLAGFESGDAADLDEKLRRLLALPPAERQALGEAARRAVVEHWSWAAVARRLLEPVADNLPRPWVTRSASAPTSRSASHASSSSPARLHGRDRGGVRPARPGDALARQPLRGAAGGRRAAPSSSRISSAS